MSERRDEPADFLPLTEAAFHVLLALADGDTHGYALLDAVRQQSGGTVRLGTGTLYGILSRLLADGLIVDLARRDPDDERRRFYRLTPLGRAVARAESERLARTVAVARAKAMLKPRKA
jgi:DNA-binding PadR family transcriptional regulator